MYETRPEAVANQTVCSLSSMIDRHSPFVRASEWGRSRGRREKRPRALCHMPAPFLVPTQSVPSLAEHSD